MREMVEQTLNALLHDSSAGRQSPDSPFAVTATVKLVLPMMATNSGAMMLVCKGDHAEELTFLGLLGRPRSSHETS